MNKRLLIPIAILMMFASSGLKAQTTLKIGHIDFDAVVAALPESDSAAIVIEKEKKEAETMYEEMLVVYNKLLDDYQKGLSGFSDLVRSSKEAELLDKQKRINDFEQHAAATLQSRGQQLMMPLYKRVVDAVESVAVESGFTYIIDLNRSGVIFKSKESVDISDMVKARLGL